MRRLIPVLFLVLFATPAHARWSLDTEISHLSFGSIKKGDIGEVHHFTEMQGAIGADGKASLTIALDSVETWIDIRNERMREFLFETARFPTATITATLDMAALEGLKVGEVLNLEVPVTLALHGQSSAVDTSLTVARLGPDRVLVVSRELVMIDASDFGYEDGIEKLMDLADLPSISAAVPVSFVLMFTRDSQ
ncbi:MAG: YceI family protein [Alphaproteobacteria bacterium]|nr:MAG: YceI family protein [Alphaproteobacteria bacterium]